MKPGYSASTPGNHVSLTGALSTVLTKFLQNVDDMLPAEVVSYDRQSNTACVRPLISVLTTEGETVPRPPIASVPVFAFGCGRYVMNFPLKAGDRGWIKANDRDISLYMQSQAEAAPNTRRKHCFEDGLFFPDAVGGFSVDGEDFDENAVIQTTDGSVRIALWADRVKVTTEETWVVVNKDGTIKAYAPEQIEAIAGDTRLTIDADGSITAHAARKIRLETPVVEMTGVFATGLDGEGGDGISTIIGGLRATRDIVSGTVSAQRHVHRGVEPGGGRTDEPVK